MIHHNGQRLLYSTSARCLPQPTPVCVCKDDGTSERSTTSLQHLCPSFATASTSVCVKTMVLHQNGQQLYRTSTRRLPQPMTVCVCKDDGTSERSTTSLQHLCPSLATANASVCVKTMVHQSGQRHLYNTSTRCLPQPTPVCVKRRYCIRTVNDFFTTLLPVACHSQRK